MPVVPMMTGMMIVVAAPGPLAVVMRAPVAMAIIVPPLVVPSSIAATIVPVAISRTAVCPSRASQGGNTGRVALARIRGAKARHATAFGCEWQQVEKIIVSKRRSHGLRRSGRFRLGDFGHMLFRQRVEELHLLIIWRAIVFDVVDPA